MEIENELESYLVLRLVPKWLEKESKLAQRLKISPWKTSWRIGGIFFFLLWLGLLFPVEAKKKKHRKTHRKAHRTAIPIVKARPKVVPIENQESPEFQTFIEKLKLVKAGKARQINTFILGDSHMQCEDFGNALRSYFVDSMEVPYAGRGFIFPYQLAKTSQRGDMLFGPSTGWSGCRFTKNGNVCDWGLAGWTAQWNQADSVQFRWKWLSNNFSTGDQIFLFSPERCAHTYQVMMGDSLGNQTLLFYDHQKRAFGGKVTFPGNKLTFTIRRISEASDFVIQGFLVQPQAPGLVMGISGTNGARLDHYLQNPDFQNHLRTINPDLLVICMGTNDAFSRDFSPEGTRSFLQLLLSKIKSAVPETAILLVGPPDHSKNRRTSNPNTQKINEVFSETADQLDFTFWNQQEAMGGNKSIFGWRRNKWATADLVHFTPTGYQKQARLLGRAIKNAVGK